MKFFYHLLCHCIEGFAVKDIANYTDIFVCNAYIQSKIAFYYLLITSAMAVTPVLYMYSYTGCVYVCVISDKQQQYHQQMCEKRWF